jgi:tetratricopeptide (TPR) repeat protein
MLGGAPLVGSEPSAIEPDEEAWVVETHRAAAMLAGHKDYPAAIDTLRKIASAHPQMAVVQYQLGILLSRTGRLQEARTAFRTAAVVEPDPVSRGAGRRLLRAGEHDEARERAGLAVALAERHDARARAAAHEMAARVALALDDAGRAEAFAEAAAEDDPAVPVAQFVRGRLLHAQGRYEEALAPFEDGAAVLKEHGRALEELYWYLGDTLARLDRFADAEMQFREELRAFPRSIRAYSSLAMLYRASNRRAASKGHKGWSTPRPLRRVRHGSQAVDGLGNARAATLRADAGDFRRPVPALSRRVRGDHQADGAPEQPLTFRNRQPDPRSGW